jgi:hypothetical protein
MRGGWPRVGEIGFGSRCLESSTNEARLLHDLHVIERVKRRPCGVVTQVMKVNGCFPINVTNIRYTRKEFEPYGCVRGVSAQVRVGIFKRR